MRLSHLILPIKAKRTTFSQEKDHVLVRAQGILAGYHDNTDDELMTLLGQKTQQTQLSTRLQIHVRFGGRRPKEQ
ncbi:hypothetical protein Tco_1242507 [Tanacetum coccineum]